MPAAAVVIATKDRPELLARLLETVMGQDLADFECVVVDDGSSQITKQEYAEIWTRLDSRFRLVEQPYSGGPAVARNTGIAQTTAPFVAFCDDDDHWTRADHLSVAVDTMTAEAADLYFAEMQTALMGEIRNPSWYRKLVDAPGLGPLKARGNVYRVSLDAIVRFFHHRILSADTLVIRRDLLRRIDGYWTRVRFAEDHDFCFRLADQANGILYRADVCAEVNLTPATNRLSHSFAERDRILFGMLSCLRVESIVRSKALRNVAKANRAWRLLELALLHQKAGEHSHARETAMQSMLVRPSIQAAKVLALQLTKKAPRRL